MLRLRDSRTGLHRLRRRGRFHWTSRSDSHPGLVRKVNEDACLDRPDRGLWAVADGMGGHSAGDLASRTVVDALGSVASPSSLESLMDDARARLQVANRELRAEVAVRKVDLIGSTVVALVAAGGRCGCLWAGDSRIYLYRGGRLRLLTRDHNRLEELRARGLIAAGDAPDHPALWAITRAVGVWPALNLEERVVDVHDGDIFLLCSDGLSNELGDAEIAGALVTGDCEHATGALIEAALRRGGRDNVSAVVVRAEDPDGDHTLFNPAV